MSNIAIIGFGFSGLLTTANLVRHATKPLTLYLIAEELDGLGVAYRTTDPQHLLNVPADKMGAFAQEVGGFYRWLQVTHHYAAADFVPRVIYGAYLQEIWTETQKIAAQKNIALKHVPTLATAIQRVPLAVLTARGDAIAVDQILLATGNETKPIAVPEDVPIVQDPWSAPAMEGVANLTAPVLLIGTGLTAVDMVLSLRKNGYRGHIIAASLRGIWPKPHQPATSVFTFDESALTAQKTLRQLLRFVRQAIATHEAAGGNWRAVIDALRPHTQALWLRASTQDRLRFFRHLMTYWTVHRHRMAPQIAAHIEAEIEQGMLRSIARSKLSDVIATNKPSRIYNCTGPQLDMRKSSYGLWKQLLAERMAEPHATGLGIAADPHYRAWGELHPNLYVIGTPMTGQWLESTAVPELRAQAAAIAQDIVKR